MLKPDSLRWNGASAALALMAWAAALVAGVIAWRLSDQLTQVVAAAALPQQPRPPQTPDRSAQAAVAQATPFDRQLPPQAELPRQMHALWMAAQGSALAKGVQLIAVNQHTISATGRSFERHEMSLTLQGSYVAVKDVIAVVTGRLPQTLLARLEVRRVLPGQEVEARVDFVRVARASEGDRP